MAKRPLGIALCGSGGRMGQAVARLAMSDPRFRVTACITRDTRGPELAELLQRSDALIDFSTAQASLSAVARAAAAGVPSVVGTTGFSPAQYARLRGLAKRIALLIAPNMSPGMNVLYHLAGRAAAALSDFDAAVSETHHKLKKDAPSGSAKRLAEAVRAARGARAVPTVSLRLGDIVGDHTLVLAGPGERLELTHRAQSRDVFARGALQAALWLQGRRPGLYSMADALGIK